MSDLRADDLAIFTKKIITTWRNSHLKYGGINAVVPMLSTYIPYLFLGYILLILVLNNSKIFTRKFCKFFSTLFGFMISVKDIKGLKGFCQSVKLKDKP